MKWDLCSDVSIADRLAEDADLSIQTQALLDGCASIAGDTAQVAMSENGTPGILIMLPVPVDADVAGEPARNMWWGRTTEEIRASVESWYTMVANMSKLRKFHVERRVVDGELYGLPGWVHLQFFFSFSHASEAPLFVDTIEPMLEILTRPSLTW